MKSRSAYPARIRVLELSQVCHNELNDVSRVEAKKRARTRARSADYGLCEIIEAMPREGSMTFPSRLFPARKSHFFCNPPLERASALESLSSCYTSAGAFRASHECLRKGNSFGHEVREFLFVSGNDILLSYSLFLFPFLRGATKPDCEHCDKILVMI